MTRELQVIQTPEHGTWMTELEASDMLWMVKERQVASIVAPFSYDLHGGDKGTVMFRRLTFSITGVIVNIDPQIERWTCDADGRGFDNRPLFLPMVWIECPPEDTPMRRFFSSLGSSVQAGQFTRDTLQQAQQLLEQERSRPFIIEPMPANVSLPPQMLDDLAHWLTEPNDRPEDWQAEPLREPEPEPIIKTRFTMGNR